MGFDRAFKTAIRQISKMVISPYTPGARHRIEGEPHRAMNECAQAEQHAIMNITTQHDAKSAVKIAQLQPTHQSLNELPPIEKDLSSIFRKRLSAFMRLGIIGYPYPPQYFTQLI